MLNKLEKNGYSLIELVIVIVILSIIMAVLTFLLARGFGNYFVGQQLSKKQAASLLTMNFLNNDLHHIRSPQDITVANANQIGFIDFNGNPITYSLNGTQLMRDDGTQQVLAKQVQTFALTYYDVLGAITTTSANIRYINVDFATSEFSDVNRFN